MKDLPQANVTSIAPVEERSLYPDSICRPEDLLEGTNSPAIEFHWPRAGRARTRPRWAFNGNPRVHFAWTMQPSVAARPLPPGSEVSENGMRRAWQGPVIDLLGSRTAAATLSRPENSVIRRRLVDVARRRRRNTSGGQRRAQNHGRCELAGSAGTEEANTPQAL